MKAQSLSAFHQRVCEPSNATAAVELKLNCPIYYRVDVLH